VHVTAQSGDSTGGYDDVKPHNLARDQQNCTTPVAPDWQEVRDREISLVIR
jgi:hypothetical protein